LREQDQEEVLVREGGPTLLTYMGEWLEKVLEAVEEDGFDFAGYMRNAINAAAEHDRSAVKRLRQRMGPEREQRELADIDKKLEAHLRLFSAEEHEKLVQDGRRQLSFRATMSCVLVKTFASEPELAGAHKVVGHVVEIDELLSQWRHRHSLIVLRTLGSKSGTGGSSGHAYLQQVLARARIFADLCHASHYLLPAQALPALPDSVRRRLAW
jgi:tryptophan 2,3-dioxygenase